MRAAGRWTGLAPAYAETFAGQCEHAIPPLLDALEAAPGTRLLDVGTGCGGVAAAALERGCLVTACDPEADMLALAAGAAPGTRLVQCALPGLPFADGAFELVSANFVVNHVPDPRAAVAELVRVAAVGGRVAASIWPSEPVPLRTLWDDVVAEAGVVAPPGAALPASLDFARTPAGLAGLLEGAGLRGVRAWTVAFVHVVEPGLWWSGVTGGVATIGHTWRAQDAAGRAAMARAYDRVSAQYLHEGVLHLPGAAVLAVGTR
ncbi:MAG: class I SAM-dependent methyltransferase [Propionicimonas sp.]|uniref:class I SAM-dependent methyltransferase n=1 Tax=Propionicimonas sp. TaxID=1955623 RepID=UPI003D0B7D47